MTSRAPRIPDLTAPSIYPFQTIEVSVPIKWMFLKASRMDFPGPVNNPGFITGLGAPRNQGSFSQSFSTMLIGLGTSSTAVPKASLNCFRTVSLRSCLDSWDHSLPGWPTWKQVMLYCLSSGTQVSRVNKMGPSIDVSTPDRLALRHQGSSNTKMDFE